MGSFQLVGIRMYYVVYIVHVRLSRFSEVEINSWGVEPKMYRSFSVGHLQITTGSKLYRNGHLSCFSHFLPAPGCDKRASS